MNTDKLIQSANTRNGFAIGIVLNGYSGLYTVVRMDARSQYVTISAHATEADARQSANVEWTADRGAAA